MAITRSPNTWSQGTEREIKNSLVDSGTSGQVAEHHGITAYVVPVFLLVETHHPPENPAPVERTLVNDGVKLTHLVG